MKYFRVTTTGRDEFVVVAAGYRIVDLAANVYDTENYYLFETLAPTVICSIREDIVYRIEEQVPYK